MMLQVAGGIVIAAFVLGVIGLGIAVLANSDAITGRGGGLALTGFGIILAVAVIYGGLG